MQLSVALREEGPGKVTQRCLRWPGGPWEVVRRAQDSGLLSQCDFCWHQRPVLPRPMMRQVGGRAGLCFLCAGAVETLPSLAGWLFGT